MNSVLAQVILPLVLAVIMFGMGLSLTRQDFLRLLQYPKVVALGLLGQIVLLPLLALAVAVFFDLSPALAIGLMIISACPSGTTSNMISHVARANLALSVSLTALTTVICIFTTPFIVLWSINYFEGQAPDAFSLLLTTSKLILITLLPVSLGILLREKAANWAIKAEPVFRKVSAGFMILMITAIVIKDHEVLGAALGHVLAAVISLNFLSIAIGLTLGKLGKTNYADRLTLGIEVGVQNASVAILIAVSFLDKPEYATTGGIYGVAMYLGVGLLALWSVRYRRRELVFIAD